MRYAQTACALTALGEPVVRLFHHWSADAIDDHVGQYSASVRRTLGIFLPLPGIDSAFATGLASAS